MPVLKNKQGIPDPEKPHALETQHLLKAYEQAEYNHLETDIFYNKSFIGKYHHEIQRFWRAGEPDLLISLFEPLILR